MGPTAVGKTAMAIDLALHFSSEIISADSRQCYNEMNIGVAKPSPEELSLVSHYFINSHSIHDSVNAAVFEQYALDKIEKIFTKNDVAVMVGGTGLYIKAFCEGLDEVPVINPGIRESINEAYRLNGFEWLQKQIKDTDPLYFARGEIYNPHRLMRALEVITSTGRSIVQFQTREKINRDFNILKIGLELPREVLYQRVNSRVDNMISAGLPAEVDSLQPYRELNALQTVGYKELFGYFDGKTTLEQATESIKLNTRHYAKRQMTWFKKDKEVNWIEPDTEAAKDLVNNFLIGS